ncbi:MAG: PaaI family thioesterase [Burkholderiaceae bacterium]|nr:PaaI family thioesterase [Burkholderiaceae bacterium]MCD8517066.1 PaaI family thioesterase [Burkholderiaceae bacterium]MCD8536886.1 PaaI family thioesterase [Burkholderiaceae bacterium]MCD8566087.1 PaaI family thioesterase [Burkholderiaceae bacterium]
MSQLRPDITLDVLSSRLGQTDNLPRHLGIELTHLEEFCLESRMPLQARHFAPNTYLHAGSVVTLADTTAGFATYAHLPDGAYSFTTIELKSNFLGTVREGAITCRSWAQHLGRNTHVWDAEVFAETTGKKLALFRCTQMILWPKAKDN